MKKEGRDVRLKTKGRRGLDTEYPMTAGVLVLYGRWNIIGNQRR